MSDITSVVVAGKEYVLIKTGRAQAEQVLAVTKWISRHGIPALKELQSKGSISDASNSLEFIGTLVEALSVDALLDLFSAMVGCSKEVSESHFDIAILVNSLVTVYEGQPSIRRLIERFFSSPASEEEQPAE